MKTKKEVTMRRFGCGTATGTSSTGSSVPMALATLALALLVLMVGPSSAFVAPGGGSRAATAAKLPRHLPPPFPKLPTTPLSTTSSQLSVLPNPLEIADAATAVTSSSSFTDSPLYMYLMQSVISNGVPAVFAVAVIAFAAKVLRPKGEGGRSSRRGRRGGRGYGGDVDDEFDNYRSPVASLYRDLYGDQQKQQQGRPGSGGNPLRKLLGGPGQDDEEALRRLPANVGVPKQQYIKLTNYNRKLDSYRYSVDAAVKGRAAAAARFRESSFDAAIRRALPEMSTSTWQSLQRIEKQFLAETAPLAEDLLDCERQLAAAAADEQLIEMGLDNVYQLDPAADKEDGGEEGKDEAKKKPEHHKSRASSSSAVDRGSLERQAKSLREQIHKLEVDFVKDVIREAGPESAPSIRAAWVGDVAARGFGPSSLTLANGERRPLTAVLLGSGENSSAGAAASSSDAASAPSLPGRRPILYSAKFPGDPTASQVATLREEITAILREANPDRGDEVLVVLQTGGGTVTGYGLAAAQLLRVKNAGVKLTVAVEQVAASGGYMMCCVADKIVASPFAVLGSIGVISDIPNVYNRLKEEGIEFQTVTAGKYKRTLTPTKKVTKEDYEKTKQDIEEIFVLFRDFVAQNRPQLDIEKVATGETWFGEDALERRLCDEIKTADEVLSDYVDSGYDVFEVEYAPPDASPFGSLLPSTSAAAAAPGRQAQGSSNGISGALGGAVGWLVRTVAAEIRNELANEFSSSAPPLEERYMAANDDAERKRTEA